MPPAIVERVSRLQYARAATRLKDVVKYAVSHIDGFVIEVGFHVHGKKDAVLDRRIETELVLRSLAVFYRIDIVLDKTFFCAVSTEC